jgi:hypothetical protein
MTICNFGTGKGGLDPTLRSTERPPPAVFQKQNMAEHLRPDAQLREFGRVSGVKIRSSLAGLAAPDSFREELLSEVIFRMSLCSGLLRYGHSTPLQTLLS